MNFNSRIRPLPGHALLIISLETGWTGIILLHAHPQIVYIQQLCKVSLVSMHSFRRRKQRGMIPISPPHKTLSAGYNKQAYTLLNTISQYLPGKVG